ncbi:MAG: hypothetical protein H0W68_00060 [Gemmatimonadaceae bacterium]|nr:hypothetical protein [Gemmatimonadaceae bacterium]
MGTASSVGAQSIADRMKEAISKQMKSVAAAGRSGSVGVEVVSGPTFDGPDTISARFLADTGTVRVTPTTRCGKGRICAPGYDLRAVALSAAGPELPAATPARLTVSIENRGTATSPTSEFEVCQSSGSSDAPCDKRLDVISIPPLLSGEAIRFTRAFQLDAGTRWLIARIDPDRATEETNRTNNVVALAVKLTHPALALISVEVPRTSPLNRPLPLVFHIRNKSLVASSLSTEMELAQSSGFWGCDDPTGTASTRRFPVPALGPRQSVTIGIVWKDVLRCRQTTTQAMEITSRIDPDGILQWAAGNERDGRYTLHAVP